MEPSALKEVLISIALFGSVAFMWWTMLEAVVRYRILKEGTSESLLAGMIAGDARRRRQASLRWGLVLVAVGLVLLLLHALDGRIDSPSGIGALLLAAGAAQLIFHRLTRADG